MVKKKFNLKKYIILTLAVGGVGAVASYFIAANSGAYRLAEEFLIKNPKVIEVLGPIKKSRLGKDYSIKESGGVGFAKIKIVLSGEMESADAFLTLEMADGVWRIKTGSLICGDQRQIELSPEVR
jgi:hypothetical protein